MLANCIQSKRRVLCLVLDCTIAPLGKQSRTTCYAGTASNSRPNTADTSRQWLTICASCCALSASLLGTQAGWDKPMKYQTRKDNYVKTSNSGRKPLIIACEVSKARYPDRRMLRHQRLDSKTKPHWTWGSLITSNWIPWEAATWSGTSLVLLASMKASSTDYQITCCTSRASSPTYAQSCSLAGVTGKVSRCCSVSTASTLPPLQCLSAF